MTALHKESSILIIGAGTFGISTAYHLATQGYKNITCLDRHHWPSPDSAGYDLNKVVRTEYDEPLYTELALEALAAWRNPEWKGIFHETGRINCITSDKDSPEYQYIRRSYDNLVAAGQGSTLRVIEGKQDIVALCPQLSEAQDIDDWKGLWNAEGGWVHAKRALEHWARACEDMGVKLISGADGTMTSLEIDGTNGRLAGIKTKSGKIHTADRYILTAGAASPAVLPELLAPHLWSKCWTLAHIELTPEEIAHWKGIPVIDNRDLGFTFEPDPETRWMKICNEFPGYQYRSSDAHGRSYSIPRYASDHPEDGIPHEAEVGIRNFINAVMPQFANRPLLGARVCWCTDTVDSHWLIDRHPEFPEHLLLATGDSGHAFKMFPIIGKYIVRALEGDCETGLRDEWRFGKRKSVKNVTRGPSEVVKDLREVFEHIEG